MRNMPSTVPSAIRGVNALAPLPEKLHGPTRIDRVRRIHPDQAYPSDTPHNERVAIDHSRDELSADMCNEREEKRQHEGKPCE